MSRHFLSLILILSCVIVLVSASQWYNDDDAAAIDDLSYLAANYVYNDNDYSGKKKSKYYSEEEAEKQLKEVGVEIERRPHCGKKRCKTSLKNIRIKTITKFKEFVNEIGCRGIAVVGGTEKGHRRGRYSHKNGYRLDITKPTCSDDVLDSKKHKVKKVGRKTSDKKAVPYEFELENGYTIKLFKTDDHIDMEFR